MNTTVRYVVSFLAPFVATLLLTPVAARLARRLGVLDHPSSTKFHREATPYLGGLAVAAGLILVGGLAPTDELLTVLACAVAISALGLVDDWRNVGPVVKIAVEAAAGAALWLAGVRAGVFGVAPLDLVLTVAWVVVVTNAVNILDNMDGIASGVAAIAALSYFVIAAGRGDFLVASMALAIAGASLGFLRHNFPPARIFLGDAGSLLLGFLLAALALKLDLVGVNGSIRSGVAILVLAVPLFDVALVVASRLIGRRKIYVGGIDHSAHRMAALGWPHRRVAGTLFAVQALAGGLAVWVTHMSSTAGLRVVGLVVAVMLTVLLVLLRLERPRRSAEVEAIDVGAPLTDRMAKA
jgi:UDP-GlcNAc:undecaprenyl-phosphate/decaprenyl-phosphate GlcNAc-1-phosphate transferase